MGARPLWARPSQGAASSYPGCLLPSAASPQGPPFPPWSHLCGVHPHGRVGHADEGGRPALPPRASGQLLDGLVQHVHPWQERSLAAAPCPSEVAAGAGCPAGSGPLRGTCSVSPHTWAFLWHPSAAAGPAALTHGPGYGQAADVQCFVLLDRLPHSIQDIHCQERRVGWDPCPPQQLPGSTPRPTGMHQARPRRSVCWAPHGPAGLRAGGSSPAAPGDVGHGESNTAPQCAGRGMGAAARPCAHEVVPCSGRSLVEMGSSVMACGSLLLATARSATICKRQSAQGAAC